MMGSTLSWLWLSYLARVRLVGTGGTGRALLGELDAEEDDVDSWKYKRFLIFYGTQLETSFL